MKFTPTTQAIQETDVLHHFKFDKSFRLITTTQEGGVEGYVLVAREVQHPSGDTITVYFDPIQEYKRVSVDKSDKIRYITQSIKDKIKAEISVVAALEPMYPLFGIAEPAVTAAPAVEPAGTDTDTAEPIKSSTTVDTPTIAQPDRDDLAKSMLNMQETINKGFERMIQKNPYEDAIVQGVISKAKSVSVDSITTEIKAELDTYIKQEYGALPKTIQIAGPAGISKPTTGIFHKTFEKIVNIIDADVPLMLVGPAGSGKSHTLEQAAAALNLDFYFTNAITQEYRLSGFIDANGTYHETEFYQAFVNGGIFFLDEVDASIPEALIMLNAAIANKYFDFPTGMVRAHENFRVVAAGNTYGTGASAQYVGRSQLDGATLDRFAQVMFDYDSNVESQLASSEELYNFIVDLRKAIAKTDTRAIVSMRATINSSKLSNALSKEELINDIILKGVPTDDRRMLIKELNDKNEFTKTLKGMVK